MLGWAGQKEVSGSEDPFQQEAEGQKSETSMQLEEGLRIRCGSHEHSVEYQDLLREFPQPQLGKERNSVRCLSDCQIKLSNEM